MRYVKPIAAVIAIAALLFITRTAFQQEGKNQLPGHGSDGEAVAPDTMRSGDLGSGTRHKYIITTGDDDVYAEFARQGAITQEIDYDSFRLIVVDESKVQGGRDSLASSRVPVRDDQDLIGLNGYILNTNNPATAYDRLPAELRKGDLANAMARGGSPQGGLYLVQFVGPIKDDWLDQLRAQGVQIVTYVPNNAYIVRGDAVSGANLTTLRNRGFVQFLGDYEPGFRLSPTLQRAYASGGDTPISVTVQVVDGRGAGKVIDQIRQLSTEFVQEHAVLNYRNVEVTVPVSHLGQIASMPDVFAVEERVPRQRMDEAQGQILAGNLTGNSPSGPGYLTWLAGKGFASGQFGTFAVNVADDAYTLSGHPDLPAARIAFQNNPTAQAGVMGGHGFLNSHIVGGFNNGTGSANEDANGFNYGLGISPFARVGITAIFGNGASTPTAWESTAYGQSARISSNSWGFTSVFRYDANAQEYDRIVRDAQTGTAGLQQLAVVFAAGNDGSGSNTVSSPGTAKNVITVGASENVRQTGTDGCAVANTGADSANDIINFSSRGPVNSAGGDGRVKPEIVAPGTHIEAGIPQSNYDGSSVCNKYWPAGQTLYGWSSGTSHSCPAVAGGSSLLYHFFLNRGLSAPSPALNKAYLITSAAYMSGTGAGGNLPSNSQGMGRMDLGRAFDGTARVIVDQTQVLGATGATYTTTGTIPSSAVPFRVTLAYTDAPGPTTGAPYVNNLDLEVTVNGTLYKGNVFSGANSITGGTADAKNNAESVFLPAGTTGSYSITVRATNIAGDGVPGNGDTTDQDFALIVYNATTGAAAPTIGVAPTSMSFSGTAGGANPASQSLSITNTGGGTLNWSASTNQPWLSIVPSSGTAPSTPVVLVSTAGLAVGAYSGAITITAAGATNTPVSVPVTLTVTAVPSPTIGVSPSSFSFSATAGGANPASQSLSITNTGGGTLNWTASSNQTWLGVSPASGTAPSSASVSANITGLVAGTYNGAITISAAGATNSPVTVPVTLTVNPAGGGELIVNGGFEGSSSPWVFSGTAAWSTGAFPHAGTGYSLMGTTNSSSGAEYETITIPTGATRNLNFWLNVTSDETTTTTQYDKVFIEVRNTSGTLLATLATFSNLNKGTAGVYVLRGPYSLAAFAGQTVRIQFRCTTDVSLITTFRIDDVSVQ
jgi:hypothetical protein